ncbi:hypothetical protein QQ020_03705 [Fulvivirgaceae bacterium BMA12]|uniref:Uncharacterized protein n=1 Tax=Agaribacillus aureus TaxID=3051825 RepID=A0ABT8L073_9BACT|nr:hypothetical protein [Fulvivirgaceae bacterium BMA12]
MKNLILMLLAVWLVDMLQAQSFPSDIWHEGKLITIDEDTVRGKIKYDLDNDLIQIESQKSIYTYGSRKILYFEIFDEYFEDYRYFYAIPYETSNNYKVPILFEVLYEGQLTLLCREYISTETIPQFNSYSGRNLYSTFKLSYNYYFISKDGNITQYYLKKKDLLTIMKKRSTEVKQFMKNNNLKFDKRGDLVRITAYYNSLLDA